jgi:DNA repair protein SbcC/Rad50
MATNKNNLWRLGSVKISNFRGIKGETTLRFDELPVLIHGNNGVGKSSIAQLIQWTIYGKFPDKVLGNTSFDSFLSPVTAKKKKSYSGELRFTRGDEKLSIYRDADKKSFLVNHNNSSFKGETAAKRLNELLQLDMDTFYRAVLLQQSKIRSILTDEIKERNKALDRLLGMDTIGNLLENLKSSKFSKKAEEWREAIEKEEESFSTKEELLQEQREKSEVIARNLKFKSQDFYPDELKKAYVNLNNDLKELSEKYDVGVEELPECTTNEIAQEANKQLGQTIKRIRKNSDLNKRLTPVETSIAELTSLQDLWVKFIDKKSLSETELKKFVKENGELETLQNEQKELKSKRIIINNDLKATNALRQLLVDARSFIENGDLTSCPVCLQEFPKVTDVPLQLRNRIEELASKTIEEKEKALDEIEEQLGKQDDLIELFDQLNSGFARVQKDLGLCHQEITEKLDGNEIAETKVKTELEKQLSMLKEQQVTLKDGINSLEQDIATIKERGNEIYSGLLPVLEKRVEQHDLEQQREKAKLEHKNEVAKADTMDALASQIDSIRNALIDSKDELSSRWLKKARPRSLELYKSLVKHPVFDTFDISTKRSKLKVDYDFKVSIGGESGSSRDARLVLSDGQLTAAAMALLFSLAESTSHSLDLLYIDDPTQNLDDLHKKAISRVICEIAKEKQVIIATQDEDFVACLNSFGFGDMAIVHHIKKWDGKPTIESSFPYE